MKTVDVTRLILSFGLGALAMRYCNIWAAMPVDVYLPPDLPPIQASMKNSFTLHANQETRLHINTTTVHQKTLNVLFGMVGNSTAFLSEWQISLKSIVLNAPLDQALHVHVITNTKANLAVQEFITTRTHLLDSYWRNPFTITVYNVNEFKLPWKKFVNQHIRGNRFDARVTLGGYYRLLAYKILPPDTYVYMDVDALVTANLNDLVDVIDRQLNIEQHLFLMAKLQPCTGFMVINTRIFSKFWDYIDQIPNDKFDSGGDQALTVMVMNNFPETYGQLPNHWSVHLGNGWRHKPHLTLNNIKKLAMLHFNGERSNNESFHTAGLYQYCARIPECNISIESRQAYDVSWGLADYYVRLPWSQVEFYGRAMTRKEDEGGFECVVQLVMYHKADVTATSVVILEKK